MDMMAGKKLKAGAIGAPDLHKFTKKSAHCDGGDYLNIPNYPQSQEKALRRLRKCQEWIFKNLDKAVIKSGKLVNSKGRIRPAHTCLFNGIPGKAKCNVLEKLGYAFHATQDFYSHSNWVDIVNPMPVNTIENPPGLGNQMPAQWLNPRNRIAVVPEGLISGCYGKCKNRVTHDILNKDTGKTKIILEPRTIDVGTTERGMVHGNFERAITVAILDTKDKWQYFEDQVKLTYPGKRGLLIICAVRSDTPLACKVD